MSREGLRREMAMDAIAQHGVSITLACRTFQISETYYRYNPVLSGENEEIADWLERLWLRGTVRGICHNVRIDNLCIVPPPIQKNGKVAS
jgi:hypothetical protein